MKGNKKTVQRIGAVSLAVAVALALGIGSTEVSAKNAEAKSHTEKKIEENYPQLFTKKEDNGQLSKDETSYVVKDADGSTKEVVVNEWLKNAKGEGSIKDTSGLSDIENTSGNESFDKKGDEITWKADGKDIRYKGYTKEELPVDVELSYYLDGKKVSAEELKGKSGKVEFHFQYHVNQRETVNGVHITHPYTMASGIVLDGASFTNVEVTGGKVINDGSNNVALGIAFPGLAKNLGLSGKLDIPETVVIKADTNSCKIDGTYTIALSGLSDALNLSGLDSVKGKVSQLENGLSKLASSSKKLVAGAKKVDDGAGALAKGSDKLSSGSKSLKEGSNTLHTGVNKLADGAATLNKAVQGISLPTVELSEGDKAAISQQAAASDKVAGAASQLTGGISSGVSKTVQGTLTSQATKSAVTSQVMGDGNVQTMVGALQKAGMSKEQANSIVAGIVSGTLDRAASKVSAESISAGISGSVSGAVKQVAAAAATSGAQGVASQVNEKIFAYGGKFDTLKSATSTLSLNMNKLAGASGSLAAGANAVDEGAAALTKGAATLSSGTKQLSSGMATFDKEGIRQLVKSLSGSQLKAVAQHLEAVFDAAKSPVFVGGKNADMNGESKIIFKTEEIK